MTGALKLMRTDVAESTRIALMLGALGAMAMRVEAEAAEAFDAPRPLCALIVKV